MVHRTQNVSHMVAEHGWEDASMRGEASGERFVIKQEQEQEEEQEQKHTHSAAQSGSADHS